MEISAVIILRLVFSWVFFRPLPDLVKGFRGTVGLVQLVVPFWAFFFTLLMFVIMFFGGLSILFGMYAQIGGLFLLIYCMMGWLVHQRLAYQVGSLRASDSASTADQHTLENAVSLGVIGHVTSSQKNIVLAGVALYFLLAGSGPISVTGNVF